MSEPLRRYRFGRALLQADARRVLVDGQPVRLGARAFDLLLALVERHDRVVGKSELLELVWPGVVVEEANLSTQMVALRKLLGPDAIATVAGRGYKFALPVDAGVPPLDGAGAPRPAGPPGRRGLPPWTEAAGRPAAGAELYGRADVVARVGELVGQHRLVSLVGAGGIGKSRVAEAVARAVRASWPDGVHRVELAPLGDPVLVLQTALRVVGEGVAPGEDAKAALIEALRDRQLLLVLDNCEHLLAAARELADCVLAGAPRVHLLVTSQEPLHRAGEHVMRLGGLATPAAEAAPAPADALGYGAVQLFVARAHAADTRFALDPNNVREVSRICRQLDGVPLAIELAAARVRLLGVRGVEQRLGERLRLLAGGESAAPARQQTLQAALEWSYALLSADERQALDRLGTFAGSFSPEAAQQVVAGADGDAWQALDHLASLVDKSLVLVEPDEPVRYRLLGSTRAFALERMGRSGGIDAARRVHARAMVAWLESGGDSEPPDARMRRIAADLDNVLAAADWTLSAGGDRDLAIELAGAADWTLWMAGGGSSEGYRFTRAVAPFVGAHTAPRAAANFWLAYAALSRPDELDVQFAAAWRAADLYRDGGDRWREYLALFTAARAAAQRGDGDAATASLQRAASLRDERWPGWMKAYLEWATGAQLYWCGDRVDEARSRFRSTLDLSRGGAGEGFWLDMSIVMLAMIDADRGHFEGAAARAREALARTTGPGDAFIRSLVWGVLGAALVGLSRFDEAESVLRSAVPRIRRAAGTARRSHYPLALLLARRGRPADAARLIGFLDGHSPSRALQPTRASRRFLDEATRLVAAELDAAEFERLRGLGRALSEDEAVALAFPSPAPAA